MKINEFFDTKEFKCKCGKCGEPVINTALIDALTSLRKATKLPIHITSGYRCPEHNAAVGGKPNSAHVRGLAADVMVNDSAYRYLFLNHVFKYFNRVGIDATFIHVDVDAALPPEVVWLYKDA